MAENDTKPQSEDESLNGLPKSFYVGQEYVEDPDRVDALILFKFHPAVLFSNIEVDCDEFHILQIAEGEVICTVEKKISKKLLNAISNPKDGQSFSRAAKFILGYIRNYMPLINKHIQRKKYMDGHILGKTVSLWDINGVIVSSRKGDKIGEVAWPVPISGFPPSVRSKELDAVFIRDLIDAMTDYFHYDLDDCIRKVITSLENCFLHYKLKLPPTSENFWNHISDLLRGKRTKIRKLINEYVQERHYPFIERHLKILRDNILFIYRLRNLLVHDKLRIDPYQLATCRKAIGTLLYLYQGNFVNDEHRAYISSLSTQFIFTFEIHCGCDLEEIEFCEKTNKKRTPKAINTPEDMNEFMFKPLRITKKEKKDIYNAK